MRGAYVFLSCVLLTYIYDFFSFLLLQFPLPHSRGSSHGQSRITRYAYPQDYYTHMMLDAFPLWDTLAREAGVDIFKYVTDCHLRLELSLIHI